MPDKKLAAILTSKAPEDSFKGGVERFNFYLENYLCRNGYTVDYYFPDRSDEFVCSKIGAINKIFVQCSAGRKLKNKGKYELIISNGGYGAGLKKVRGTRFLSVHHGTSAGLQDSLKSKISLKRFLLDKYLIYGLPEFLSGIKSRRVAVGNSVRYELKKYYHADSFLLCNAVDTDHFRRQLKEEKNDSKALTCIFISRFDYWIKGFDILLKMINRLKNIRWILIISGEHNLVPCGNVEVYENISYKDLPRFYNKADIAIYLSRYEGNSYYLLEALSSSLPVIATSAGEAKYIYRNNILNDLLIKSSIESDNVIAEIESMVEMLRDKNKRESFGRVSRKIIEEKYSLTQWERELSLILEKI
ncbi:MAG: glycosyltransferase family 4 protein [Bacteroidota bacterium]|nr:glycosyltransferase family 4 protein [Bacteroidota bacterium]